MKEEQLLAEAFTFARGAHELLEQAGVPLATQKQLVANQPAGVTRIQTLRSGLWEPAEEGQLAITLPVVEPAGFDVFDLWWPQVALSDVLAFNPDHPARWYWRTGAGFALGLDQVDAPRLELVDTPLAWLQRGGQGFACIVNWEASPADWRRLLEAPQLIVRSSDLRRRLVDQFRGIAPMPDLVTA